MSLGNNQRKSKGMSQGSTRRPPIEKGRWAAKGTKPLPEQASVQHVLSVMLIHVCRKVLFIATEVKITLYSIALFFGSLVCDFLPIPKMYMSSKENLFNQYFVKIGWAWTLAVIVKRHMSRMLIGTGFWLFWSQFFFDYVENKTGVCLGKAILKDKYTCNGNGFQWHSFDISGHAFLLVYINLLLVEEAKAIVGWEGIRDLLRVEEHGRMEGCADGEDKTTLSALSQKDLVVLKENYETWTPVIRFLFLCMTLVSLLSDVMLACTVIYFHTMPQKVAGGVIAIGTWYFTYRFWFKYESSPGLPGKGLFSYQHLADRSKESFGAKRRTSIVKDTKDLPTFMGMPIYGNVKDRERKREEDREEDRSTLTEEPEFNRSLPKTDNSRFIPKGDFFSPEPRYGRKPRKVN
ncbi:FIT family protein [Armadillidium vulgare]|nr:FIT family protein [Armadillidium vulgare]